MTTGLPRSREEDFGYSLLLVLTVHTQLSLNHINTKYLSKISCKGISGWVDARVRSRSTASWGWCGTQSRLLMSILEIGELMWGIGNLSHNLHSDMSPCDPEWQTEWTALARSYVATSAVQVSNGVILSCRLHFSNFSALLEDKTKLCICDTSGLRERWNKKRTYM